MIVELLAGISGSALLVSIGMNVWQGVKLFRSKDEAADARVAQVAVEADYERAQFENETLRKALSAANARAAQLEEILNASPSDLDLGLSAADWRSRYLRLTQQWGADTTAYGVPPDSGRDGLPADAAAEPAEAPAMSPIGDVLR